MASRPIQRLADLFLKLPGVGPRQAMRFAFFLLRAERAFAAELAQAVARLHDEARLCQQCYKTFDANHGALSKPVELCEVCRDGRRNQHQVLVVEKEVDLENVEGTGTYDGAYHVLTGTMDPLDSSAPARLHVRELLLRLERLAAGGPAEVILATNATAEGDATALYLERTISPLRSRFPRLTISRLGRGLTTGTELEYSDGATIASALANRK